MNKVVKRHLNVIPASATEEATPTRSTERWILLGTILVVAVWLPLGMLGLWLSRGAALGVERMAPRFADWPTFFGLIRPISGLLPIIGSFALAASLGGITVVRFGPSSRSLVPAGLAGGLAGALVATLAAVAGALRPWPLGVMAYATLISVGGLSAAGGGQWGRRLRNAANLTSLAQPKVDQGH